MTAKRMPAIVRLRDSEVVPDFGFSERSLGVSLTSDYKLRTAWRGEIRIADDAPWHRGEERLVELTIEAKPFEDYVLSWRPTLYVCRDNQIIGLLTLAEPNASLMLAPHGPHKSRSIATDAATASGPETRADFPDPCPETETLRRRDS
jgi:hypothetical protein